GCGARERETGRATPPSRPPDTQRGPAYLWHYDNLPELLLVFQALMGRSDFGKRINAVDHRTDLLPEDEFEHRMHLAHRAHKTAEQGPLLAEEKAEVDLRVVPRGRAAGDETSRGSERFETLLPGGDTDVLDHDIDPALAGNLADFG